MKRTILLIFIGLLLCDGVAWGGTISGDCKNGSWTIDDNGLLTVNINGKMADYGEGNAPWYKYAEMIKGIHIGSGCTNVGRNGFYGLNKVTKVTGGENVTACAMYSFEKCGDKNNPIPQIYFPQCDYVGECAFTGTKVQVISLKKVGTWKAAAISGGYVDLSENIAVGKSGCRYADLGSDVTELRPGSVKGPEYVFIQNSTPPNWERLYARDEEKYGQYVFASIASLGIVPIVDAISGNSYRQYDYPFGDNPNVKVIVPTEHVDTYKQYYLENKGLYYGFMSEYYPEEHGKYAQTGLTGRIYGGEPIYSDGEFIGWWYVEGDENKSLHIGFLEGKEQRFDENQAPWQSELGSVSALYIHGEGARGKCTIPDGMFRKGKGLQGIKTIYLTELDTLVVGSYAFAGCNELEEVNCINGIKNIIADKYAFANCTSLKTFYGNVKLDGDHAFSSCTNLTNDNKTLQLQKGQMVVPESSFYDCFKLNTINLENVQEIGDGAFCGTGLETLVLSSNKFLHQNAFANSKVRKIYMNEHPGDYYSVSMLENEAFANCTLLTDIYVQKPLMANGTARDAFSGLDVRKITLNVNSDVYEQGYSTDPVWSQMRLSGSVFPLIEDDWELTMAGVLTVKKDFSFDDPDKMAWGNYKPFIREVVIDEGVTTIGNYCFEGLTNLTTVKVPKSCKDIRFMAFANCQSLKKIDIGGIEYIGDRAFEDCSQLEWVYLGMGLKEAGNYIFRNCKMLVQIVNKDSTPAKVTDYTFAEIGSPTYDGRAYKPGMAGAPADNGQAGVTLEVPDEFVTNYIVDRNWGKFHITFADSRGRWVSAGRFGDGTWILYEDSVMVVAADKGPGKSYSESNADLMGFGRASDPNSAISRTRRVEFTGNMTRLAGGFHGFPNLESVKLCPSIRTLDGTFEQCTKLKEINLENIDTLGEWTFSRSGVEVVNLPSTRHIGRGAFHLCKHLKLVSLGQPCEIKRQAFFYCDSLVAINLSDATLDDATECFTSCYQLKAVAFTGKYLPENVFANCSALTHVSLGECLDSIDANAFRFCDKIDTIYCANPTPPAMPWGKRQIYNSSTGEYEYLDAQAFYGRKLENIRLFVPADLMLKYKKADVWKDMTMETDPNYVEDLLPTGGAIGDKGTWYLDTDGTLTLDYEGSTSSVEVDGSNIRWHDLLAPWMPFIKKVVISDRVREVPYNMAGEHNPENSADVVSVELGTHITDVNVGALNYSGLKDVYCYTESCPVVWGKSFDWDALTNNNATLHVVTSAGVLERFKASKNWSRFPNIVADLPSRMPADVFHTQTVEGLEMWFRVTDEAAKTCETSVNDVIGRAVEHDTYKQYDNLTIPETVEHNGVTYTVTGIGDKSFRNCSSFANFTLPETIERIGMQAFFGDINMHVREFTLPANVKFIGEGAFEMWTDLERMTVESQWPTRTVADNFINTYWDPAYGPKPVLLVPNGTRMAWNTSPWSDWFVVYDPYNKDELAYKVKPGADFESYYENYEDDLCIKGLMALGIIEIVDEQIGEEYDELAECWNPVYGNVVYNKDGKRLFITNSIEGGIEICNGVTSADDIHYEFKEDDYEVMAYTTGRNIDLYRGAAILFPDESSTTNVYFTATNDDGQEIGYHIVSLEQMTCEVEAIPGNSNAVAYDESRVTIPATVLASQFFVYNTKTGYTEEFEPGVVPQIVEGLDAETPFAVIGIGNYSFNDMMDLSRAMLPHTIRYICEGAFANCENLTSVYIDCDYPPTLLDDEGYTVSLDNHAFEGIGVPAGSDPELDGTGGATLHVPVGCKEAYNVSPWTEWFYYGIQADIKPEVDEEIKGDVNSDKKVDVADIASILSVMAGTTNIPFSKADVNNDGKVDVADIASVLTRMAELARRAHF